MSTILSVCIITKNEKENLKKCITALKEYPFEIIVVDTGSTDGTQQMLQQMLNRIQVECFTWCNDFAAARNFAISKASNDMIMVIDSDEYLDQIDVAALKHLIKEHPDQVGRIKRRNILHRNDVEQENREWINRIFSRKKYHYEGRIHEQIVVLDGSEEYETYQAPVTILHSGYDLPEEERREKAKRNIDLLDMELQRLTVKHKSIMQNIRELGHDISSQICVELLSRVMMMGGEPASILQKDNRIPYVLYQLGKSYYMAGDYRNACTYFECGLYFDLNPKLEYVIDMVETYGYALINSGQAKQAIFMESIYDEFGTTADFKFLMGLIYMNNEMYKEAIQEFKKASQMPDGRTKGTNSYLANYNIGVIYECLGELANAENYYKKCGEYAPACRRLKELEVL